MEVFTLDSQLRRVEVIDLFKSLIWTERFTSAGEFELVINNTPANRALLLPQTKLSCHESQRVMMVETVEEKDDSSGLFLNVSGRSLEAIFEDRIVKQSMANVSAEPKWKLSGKPGDLMRQVFDHIVRNGTLTPSDKIPYLRPGTITPAGTLYEPEEIITIEQDIDTLYSFLSSLGTTHNLGYRLLRNGDNSELYFEVYAGDNRTSAQRTLPAVIFSSNLDNLADTTKLTSIQQYKNVAYVFAPNGTEVVYAASADPSTAGFERRVLIVKADDVTEPAGDTLRRILTQRGMQALAENRGAFAFDGELPPTNNYVYDKDYRLGDLVEMQSSDGIVANMRVSEQIFVSDAEGDRAYPTLSAELFITPDSWYGWDQNEVWEQAEGVWEDA